ncbi:MAG TPA: glycosyltransferase family 4 protein, partial [Thermoplasmata archaeon]|nr:glycosyltransferase family 4 protein [Thermoplasmata archaeon]
SIEGGWLRHRIRGFYDRWIAGGVVREASRIIVQTHEEERLLRSLRIELPPLEIIPPGYRPLPDPPAGAPSFSERFGIPGPFVLFVGRLASNKGLLDLAEAFAPLAAADRWAHLVVVGEDGGQREPFVAKVQKLGTAGRVHLLGHVGDDAVLASAYREARLTVLPSEYEAFGLVLLESLAAGTPVVASRVGGIPEFIEDGKAGLLVPPKTPKALAEAIARIWNEPELARRFGEYGRDQVVPRYQWDSLVDRLDRLYREVVPQ